MLDLGQIQDAMDRDDQSARKQLRSLSRQSLYFHTKAVICYNFATGPTGNLMSADVFKERQDWIQWVFTDHKRGLLEDPRAHAKSWGSTVPLPSWLAAQTPHPEYDDPREVQRQLKFLENRKHLRGPDSRIVIVSDSVKHAANRWVSPSKAQWVTNPFLRWLWPEFLWENPNKPDYGAWSNFGYHLNGRKNPTLTDPFLRPAGIDSKEQGGRAEAIMIEDIVGETSYRSMSELDRRKEYVRTISQLLENQNYRDSSGGVMFINGNRWALTDVNSMVHNEMPYWAVWRRAAYRCTVHGAGSCGRWDSTTDDNPCKPTTEPLWKDVYPDHAALAAVESSDGVGAGVFACQWMNDPTTQSDLDASLLRPFVIEVREIDQVRAWCIVVPAGELSIAKEEIIPLASLAYHSVSIDPASSTDASACNFAASWIAFDAPTRRYFWLDCQAGKYGPDKALEVVLDLVMDVKEKIGRLPRILCEKVATQDFVGSGLRALGRARGQRIPLVEMIPVKRGMAKEDRNRNVYGSALGQGQVYLRSGLQSPRTETRHFPAGGQDALDTFTQAASIFSEIHATMDMKKYNRARKRMREHRFNTASRAGVGF